MKQRNKNLVLIVLIASVLILPFSVSDKMITGNQSMFKIAVLGIISQLPVASLLLKFSRKILIIQTICISIIMLIQVQNVLGK